MAENPRESEGDGTPEEQVPAEETPKPPTPPAEFRMELVDGLPGGRAVMGVEQDGEFMWLADRNHVSAQARDEFFDQISRMVEEGWWIQNWPGR